MPAPEPSRFEKSFTAIFNPAAGEHSPQRRFGFLIVGVILADFMLYQQLSGITYGLALLIAGFGLLWYYRGSVERRAVSLTLAYLALLAFRCAWQASALPVLLGFLLVPVLAVVCASPLGHLPETFIIGVLSYATGGGGLLLAAAHLRQRLNPDEATGKRSCLWLLLPLLGALLAVIIFGAIFIYANPVLDRAWTYLYDHLGAGFIPSFGHLCFWLLLAWLLAGLLVPCLPPPLIRWLTGLKEKLEPLAWFQGGQLEALTAIAILAAVNCLFLVYNLVDATYLWFKVQLPAGITYSEYARGGATWLTVALYLSTALIGVATSVRLAFHPRAGTIRLLAYVWAMLDLVLAVGVLRRIQLYIAYNGLTPLRITGLLGTLLVITGLLVMLVKLARGQNLVWIVRRYCLAFGVALVILAIVPSDYLCARFNVAMALRGNDRPLVWLVEHDCSSEGLPALLPLLKHRDPVVRDGIAGFLRHRYARLDPLIRTRFANPGNPPLLADYYAHELLTANRQWFIQAEPGQDEYDRGPAFRKFEEYVSQWRNGSEFYRVDD